MKRKNRGSEKYAPFVRRRCEALDSVVSDVFSNSDESSLIKPLISASSSELHVSLEETRAIKTCRWLDKELIKSSISVSVIMRLL